jgi:hypothetical protein
LIAPILRPCCAMVLPRLSMVLSSGGISKVVTVAGILGGVGGVSRRQGAASAPRWGAWHRRVAFDPARFYFTTFQRVP